MHSRIVLVFMIILFLTQAAASFAQPMNPSDAVETVGQGMINWTSGEVYATGIGAPPPNAVNPAQRDEDLGIERAPACSLKDDSDLGERLVTVQVPLLPAGVVATAMQRGARIARQLQGLGLIHTAVLACQGQWHTVDAGCALPQAA